jgi:hypothetical protein
VPPGTIMKKTASFARLLPHVGFMLGLIFNPEDGNDMFLRNVGCPSMDYTALYPRI